MLIGSLCIYDYAHFLNEWVEGINKSVSFYLDWITSMGHFSFVSDETNTLSSKGNWAHAYTVVFYLQTYTAYQLLEAENNQRLALQYLALCLYAFS